MSELIWHTGATIELSISLPVEGGLPINDYETNRFRGVQIAFGNGLVYIQAHPNHAQSRVFVLPLSAVVRAELPSGMDELIPDL